MEYISKSIKQTKKIASNFAKSLHGGEIIALSGDLGAGKTVFCSGLILSQGIKENVTSPTFTIVNAYCGKKYIINHFDLYRIEDENELDEIGFNDFIENKNAISIIEWPERTNKLNGKITHKIEILKIDDNKRKIIIQNII